MLELFVYPVSLVMKGWHMLLSTFLDSSLAWVISVPLLVITVRSLLWPLNWQAIKMGRKSALIAPDIAALADEYPDTHSSEYRAAVKELRAANGLRPGLGCLPPLIMIPVFLGLYRLLLWMAKPSFDKPIGVMSRAEVDEFRNTLLNGVPLPAYAAMPESVAAHLGTTADQVRHLIMPILIAALVCTTVNFAITLYRGYLTTNFNTRAGRVLFRIMVVFLFLTPYLLWKAALHGPVPVAIIFYWLFSNGYTLIQTLVNEYVLRTRYPLTDAVHAHRRENLSARKEYKALPRAEKRARKRSEREERKRAARERQAARKAEKTGKSGEKKTED